MKLQIMDHALQDDTSSVARFEMSSLFLQEMILFWYQANIPMYGVGGKLKVGGKK